MAIVKSLTPERAHEIVVGYNSTAHYGEFTRGEYLHAKGFLEAHALLSSENEKLKAVIEMHNETLRMRGEAMAVLGLTVEDSKLALHEAKELAAKNEKLAGMVKDGNEAFERMGAAYRDDIRRLNEELDIRVRKHSAEIASLRAENKRPDTWAGVCMSYENEIAALRAEMEHLAWNLAGCLTFAESRRITDYASDKATPALKAVVRVVQDLTLHREAAKGLVEAARFALDQISLSHLMDDNGHSFEMNDSIFKLKAALASYAPLTLSEAKTSPQDPERGK